MTTPTYYANLADATYRVIFTVERYATPTSWRGRRRDRLIQATTECLITPVRFLHQQLAEVCGDTASGVARCSVSDTYSRTRGCCLALDRATDALFPAAYDASYTETRRAVVASAVSSFRRQIMPVIAIDARVRREKASKPGVRYYRRRLEALANDLAFASAVLTYGQEAALDLLEQRLAARIETLQDNLDDFVVPSKEMDREP